MSSSTLEEALRHYLKFFDGHKKEFSPSLRRAFDTIYHKEFYNRTSSKNVISRDRLLQIQQQHFVGNKTKLIYWNEGQERMLLQRLQLRVAILNCM